MELKITVAPENFVDDLSKTMALLTPEQRLDIAKQVFQDILSADIGAERAAYELKVIVQLKQDSYHRGEDDDRIRGGYKYREEMAKFRPTKLVVVDELIKVAQEHAKSVAKEMIENDETVKLVLQATLDEVKKNALPMVQQIMTQFFFKSLSDLGQTAYNAQMQATSAAGYVQNIQQQLQSKGVI
jgi:hypothetical protein